MKLTDEGWTKLKERIASVVTINVRYMVRQTGPDNEWTAAAEKEAKRMIDAGEKRGAIVIPWRLAKSHEATKVAIEVNWFQIDDEAEERS